MSKYLPINTKYSWGSTFYCSPCNTDLKAIPVNQYCTENHVTRSQVRSMLRSRQLFGLMSQGKFYVCNNPNYK